MPNYGKIGAPGSPERREWLRSIGGRAKQKALSTAMDTKYFGIKPKGKKHKASTGKKTMSVTVRKGNKTFRGVLHAR